MLIIAHRGNISGAEPALENTIDHVETALSNGFDVEVDVWSIGNIYMLGHDTPQVEVSTAWLRRPRMWCHAKNIEALVRMQADTIHCFWHDTDAFTLTSRNGLWCYPGNFNPSGITVITGGPETVQLNPGDMGGVCTDQAILWQTWADSNGI
jgi:hypothetical protein